jgi:hypothetical protein
LSVPNYREDVAHAASRYPNEWRSAHTGGVDTEAFIRLLARDLHAIDPRIGLNGKRGNPDDISDDALNFKGEGAQYDPTNSNSPVSVIDVIGGAGGANPTPQWTTFDDRHAGAWVKPSGAIVVPPPVVKPGPDPAAHLPKPVVPYPGDAYVRGALGAVLASDYAARPQAMDDGSVVWAFRVIWDHVNGGLSLDASIAKHRPEWRRALGLE